MSKKKSWVLTLAAMLLVSLTLAPLPKIDLSSMPWRHPVAKRTTVDNARYMQDASVTVRVGDDDHTSTGTGILRTTSDGSVWVWTCAHVVAPARVTREEDGRTIVEFGNVKIIQKFRRSDDTVGELTLAAEIIRYGNEPHDDLALLRILANNFVPATTARFYLEKNLPPLGSELMLCGTFLGEPGQLAIVGGLNSLYNRQSADDETALFDQAAFPGFPGGSGGMIALHDGRVVGLLSRSGSPSGTLSMYVPVRHMREWARRVGVEFTMDPAIHVPTESALRSYPVEESTTTTSVR